MKRSPDDRQRMEERIASLEAQNQQLKEKLAFYETAAKWSESTSFQHMIEQLPDVIWSMDLDFNFNYLSPATEKLFGYRLDERKHVRLNDIFSKESLQLFKELLSKQLHLAKSNPEANTAITFEACAIHKNGHQIWVEINADFEKDKQKQVVGIKGITRDISQRKETEEKLKASEKQFQLIANNINEMLLIMDENFNYTYISPSCKNLHGYTPEEFKKINLKDFLTESSYKEVDAAFKERMKNEQSGIKDTTVKSFETQSYHKQGHLIRVQVTTTPIYDNQGNFKGLIGVSRDITQIKKAEQARQQAVSNFKFILKHDPNAIAVFDEHLKYIYVSDRYLKYYNVTYKDIIGKHHYEVFPEIPGRWRDIHQRALHGEILKNDDDHFVRADGSITYNRWECRPWYKEDNSIGGIIMYTEVTTERKKAELELKESEENLRLITENSIDIIARFSPEGRFIYVSPSIEKVLGYTAQEFMNRDYLELVHDDDKSKIQSRFGQFLKKNALTTSVSRYYKKDGSIVWLETSLNVVYDDDGNIRDIVTISRDITERVVAEKKFKALYSRYETIVKHFPNGAIFLFDKDLTYQMIAGRALEELGFETTRGIGKHISEVFSPDISTVAVPEGEKILNGENVYYEAIYENRYFANWGIPIKNEENEIFEGLVFAIDITELKQKNVFIQTVLDNLPIGLALNKFNEGVSTYVNKKFEEIYGWPAVELKIINDFFLKVYPDETYRDKIKDRIYQDVNSGDPSRMHWENVEITCKDGSKKIINAVNIPLLDQNTMVSTVMDMTDHHLAKEKVKESEQLFKGIFMNSPLGIALLGQQFKTLNVNQKLCDFLGYAEDEIKSRTFKDVTHPDDYQEDMEKALELVEGKKDTYKLEKRFLTKNGEISWGRISAAAIRDANGDFMHIIGMIEDINEQKESEKELIKAKEKAEESDRLKSAFLANMSHEIRTPMNGIIGFSEMLNKDDISDERRKHYAKVVMNSSHQLLNIVNDILDISKLEAGEINLTKEDINLNDLIMELFAFYKPKIRDRNLSLLPYKGLRNEESIITADKTKLTQIFNNLLSNAFKFTPEGHIKYGYTLQDKKLQFFVEDTGIGISEEMYEAVFERFRQVETGLDRQYGGTGLGLSISKKLVHLMHGEIWLESESGKGTTFFFTIPYNPGSKNEQTASHQNGIKQSNRPEDTIVLIAEDEEINYIYLEEILEDQKFKTVHAKNGKEAVNICENNEDIALVLMDIKMPFLNGYEATSRIKMIRPELPVVAQTAYALSEDREKALQFGFDGYISKPIDKDELLGLLKNYLPDVVIN